MHALESTLSIFSQISFKTYKSTAHNILQEHTFIKKRNVRANQASYISSKTRKGIMRRTRLRNKLDPKTDGERTAYNKQRNYCVSLIPKEKKAYFNNLKICDVTDSKSF